MTSKKLYVAIAAEIKSLREADFDPEAFDGESVPSARLPDDLVTCVFTGIQISHSDAFYDCEGHPYCDDGDRDDADADIVARILDQANEKVCEYVETDDYADGYISLVTDSDEPQDAVINWLMDQAYSRVDTIELAAKMDVLKGIEVHFQSSEYDAYQGSGIALYSFAVGEEEGELWISEYPQLERLDAVGGLEAALNRYHGDAYLHAKTVYDNVLRKHVHVSFVRYGCISFTSNASGCWHYVVPESVLVQALKEIS